MESATWVEWLKALAAPIVAVAAVTVSYQQVLINRTKLRVDMYERRIAVYEQVREFLRTFSSEGQLTATDLGRFRSTTAHAVFLCPPRVVEYLAELDRRAVSLIRALHRRELFLEGQINLDIEKLNDAIDELEVWFMDAHAESVEIFKDALAFESSGLGWLTKQLSRWWSGIRLRIRLRRLWF